MLLLLREHLIHDSLFSRVTTTRGLTLISTVRHFFCGLNVRLLLERASFGFTVKISLGLWLSFLLSLLSLLLRRGCTGTELNRRLLGIRLNLLELLLTEGLSLGLLGCLRHAKRRKLWFHERGTEPTTWRSYFRACVAWCHSGFLLKTSRDGFLPSHLHGTSWYGRLLRRDDTHTWEALPTTERGVGTCLPIG